MGYYKHMQSDLTAPDNANEKAVWLFERGLVFDAIFDTSRKAKHALLYGGYKDDPLERNPYTL
ncbi:hypothetical protein IMZ48_29565 [Candidatus Bathyarchaeota archaeon]|nr:hypothetical protein [Candidatus Bathyarchaeota archaeon]